MTDDLTAQVREILLRSAGLWAGDESEKAWAAISVDTLAPRIAACMQAVGTEAWECAVYGFADLNEASISAIAAGLAKLRGET